MELRPVNGSPPYQVIDSSFNEPFSSCILLRILSQMALFVEESENQLGMLLPAIVTA